MRLLTTSLVVVVVMVQSWMSQSFLVPAGPKTNSRRTALYAHDESSSGTEGTVGKWCQVLQHQAGKLALGLALLATAATPMESAWAISGGGKDYAEAKIVGQDFSGQDLSNKDFSGAIAMDTKFVKSVLKGTRFYKANLKGADFTGADLSGASLENAALDGASFRDAIMANTYQSIAIQQAGDILNADFTDSLLRPDVQGRLCGRPDASGVNPKTKVSTRESLMCE